MKKAITIATLILALASPAVPCKATPKDLGQLTQLVSSERDEKTTFTEQEVREEYEDFYKTSKRRKDRITEKDGRYFARYADNDIEVPKKFIENFLKHLEKAKEEGYYEYLFYADLNHCHSGLPKDHFDKEYSGLSQAEMREKSLKDDNLMQVYHSREYLVSDSPKKMNRNFIGYFDGREVKLVHPKKENGYHTLFDYDREEMKEHDDYYSVEGLCIFFQAHKDGLFQLKDGTRLDIAL